MATIPAVSLNAIERKNLLKKAEQLYKTTHCKTHETTHTYLSVIVAYTFYYSNFSDNRSLLFITSLLLLLFCCLLILYLVSQKEVECLLYAYRGLTKSPEGRVDRVTFRDLLHDHFIMSDDFFMDRGEE